MPGVNQAWVNNSTQERERSRERDRKRENVTERKRGGEKREKG